MIGTGKNPNVAAVIVIGIEPKWTKRIVDAIATTGKPVEGFHIESTGDIGTIMKASKKAQEFSQWASEKQREECPMSDLWISVKCGESDTTSGLASNPDCWKFNGKIRAIRVFIYALVKLQNLLELKKFVQQEVLLLKLKKNL